MNICKIVQDAKASMVLGAAVATLGLSAGAVESEAVQLWEGGPCFATCNVGATKPEESGYYFWWGDTVGYVRNGSSWDAVDGSKTGFSFSSENCPTNEKDDKALKSEGWIGDDGNLVAAHDAARAHLGAPWRMMTKDELDKLVDENVCQWTCVTEYKGVTVNGWVVKGKEGTAYENNEVFFPMAGDGSGSSLVNARIRGYYWSSTPYSVISSNAWYLHISSILADPSNVFASGSKRYLGFSVRAVKDTPVLTTVTVDKVESGEPWSKVTVNYTLGGLDADLDYKVAFDVTANGVTRGVTNAAAKLTDGASSKVIDTVALFGAAKADPKAKVRVSLIAVKPGLGGVQLWEGGPYWAECNVGATKPEEFGYYFWWGDTVGYKRNANNDGWVSAADGTTSIEFSFSKSPANSTLEKTIPELLSAGYIDSTGNLVAKYDAATAHLGAPWRMPTDAEFSALINNCDTEQTTRNGVVGRLVKGRGAYASKSIFLPAAGQGWDSALIPGFGGLFWSSTPYSDDPADAWYLGFNSNDFDRYWGGTRSGGHSVRPVRGFAK